MTQTTASGKGEAVPLHPSESCFTLNMVPGKRAESPWTAHIGPVFLYIPYPRNRANRPFEQGVPACPERDAGTLRGDGNGAFSVL